MSSVKGIRYLLCAAYCILHLSCSSHSPPAQRGIVCLVPSVTEIIYALGQEKQLVGNTTFCNYPEAAQQIYKVGDFSNPSTEKIIALKPRLVFATLPEQQSTVEKLKKMGIKIFISRPSSLDSMLEEIVSIGKVLGAGVRAETLVDSLRQRLARIPVPVNGTRVYLEISAQPLMSVGKASFLNEAVERAGGSNVFADIDKEYPVVTQEQIIARNPEVIFILHPQTTNAELLQRLGWKDVAAVKARRVYDDLNPDILFRPGPRIIEGIEQMAEHLQRKT